MEAFKGTDPHSRRHVKQWPFKWLMPGQTCTIPISDPDDPDEWLRSRTAAYMYGSRMGKKFTTHRNGDVLEVTRKR